MLSAQQQCEEMKSQGNSLYALGQYNEAIQKYEQAYTMLSRERAIQDSSSIPLAVSLASNAALCYSILRNRTQTIHWASEALQLEPTHSKSLARKETAEAMRVTVETLPIVGRSLIAVTDFAEGEVVLEDSPIMVFSSLDEGALVRAFCELPTTSRNGVMTLYHPPFEDVQKQAPHLFQTITRRSEELTNEFKTLDAQTITRLQLIARTNSHTFMKSQSALFFLAAMATHSCRPNCMYTSKKVPGKLLYVAVRKINAGEIITFPYIGELCTTPTQQRRAILQETKYFQCACDRCVQYDLLRPMWCERGGGACDGDGIAFYKDSEGWKCTLCGSLPSASCVREYEKVETALLGMLETLESKAKVDFTSVKPSTATQLIAAALTKVPATHHVIMKMLELASKLYTTHAEHGPSSGEGGETTTTTKASLYLAGATHLWAATMLAECSFSGSPNCVMVHHGKKGVSLPSMLSVDALVSAIGTHPPVSELCVWVLRIFWNVEALLSLRDVGDFIADNRNALVSIKQLLSKYVPLLELQLQRNDADLKKLKRFVMEE
eukprot:PhF_6_TR38120/c0_g1_i1/m.56900